MVTKYGIVVFKNAGMTPYGNAFGTQPIGNSAAELLPSFIGANISDIALQQVCTKLNVTKLLSLINIVDKDNYLTAETLYCVINWF